MGERGGVGRDAGHRAAEDPELHDAHRRVGGRRRSTIVSATALVDRVHEQRPRDGGRVVVRVLGRVDLRVAASGWTMSAIGVGQRAERGDRALTGLGRRRHRHMSAKITSLPCRSSGTNGIGGQGMTLAIVDSSSGAASAAAMNPAITSGVAGRISMPPTIVGRARGAGTGTASRPRSCRHRRGSPRTGRDPCRHRRAGPRPSAVTISAASSVVDGQAELAHEVADAATERDPAEPDRAGVAEAGREAVLGRGRRVLGRRQAGPGPGRAPVDVDLERRQVAQVDDDARPPSCCGRRRCGRRCGPRAPGHVRARARRRRRRRSRSQPG